MSAPASAAPGARPACLSGLDPVALGEHLAARGIKPGHAARLLRAHLAGVTLGPATLPGLPARVFQPIGELLEHEPAVVARSRAADGTTKLLLRLADGRTVESVLMPDFRPDRAAGCLSTQVGCAMGCDFCATTRTGFERNLTTGEILAQLVALRREARLAGRELRTAVLMGMGEPMLNLEAVLPAVRQMADNQLGALGWRQITVSTVGIVPGIDALIATGWGVQLAVSLHAPDDETRGQILPMGRRHGIAAILEAADRFQAARGRPVIIQYCLLAGVNDRPEHARRLVDWLAGRRMHLNLLTYNPTGLGLGGRHYQRSPDAVAEAFARVTREGGVVTHFRRSRGVEVAAACGQLRSSLGGSPALGAPASFGSGGRLPVGEARAG